MESKYFIFVLKYLYICRNKILIKQKQNESNNKTKRNFDKFTLFIKRSCNFITMLFK